MSVEDGQFRKVGPAGRLLYDLKYGRMCQRLDEEDENAL